MTRRTASVPASMLSLSRKLSRADLVEIAWHLASISNGPESRDDASILHRVLEEANLAREARGEPALSDPQVDREQRALDRALEAARFDNEALLDYLTARLTCSATFRALVVGTHATYRPTLRASEGPRYVALADAYDAWMEAMGDARRAYRGREADREGLPRRALAAALRAAGHASLDQLDAWALETSGLRFCQLVLPDAPVLTVSGPRDGVADAYDAWMTTVGDSRRAQLKSRERSL